MNYEKLEEIILNNLISLVGTMTSYVPRILAAVALLFMGYIVSKLIAKMLGLALRKMGERVGLTELLGNWNIQSPLSYIVGKFLFLFLFSLFLMSVAEVLEMRALSGVFDKLFLYLPNILGAFIVFMASAIAGHFAKNMVFKTCDGMNLDFAKPLSNVVYFSLMLIGVILAMAQLKIETAFLTQIIQILLLGITVAIALSLGIGSRDISKNLISGVYLKEALKEGAYVKVGEFEGTLVSVRPVSFELVDSAGKSIILPNSRLLDCEIIQKQ